MSLWQRLFNPVGALLSEIPSPAALRRSAPFDKGGSEGGAERGIFALQDPQGRDLPAAPRRPEGGPTVTVRLEDTWGTHPSSGLNPSKLAAILNEADAGHTQRAMELAEEIEAKSPRILSGMRDRRLAVQQLQWTVTPASEDAKDVEIADFVRKNLQDCGLREPLGHMQDANLKGFAALWINWRHDGDKIWLHSLDWTPQSRWTFAPRDFSPHAPAPLWPRILTAAEPIYGEEAQPFAWLIARDASRSTTLNKAGLWRSVVWYYLFANFSVKDWLVFLDTLGMPFVVGKYPTGTDATEIDVLKAGLRAFTARALAVNDQMMIDIIESKATSGDLHSALARYCDEQITIAILGQTASTQGTPGTMGNEKLRGQVRDDIIQADAAARAEEIRQQLIWPLVGWNFGFDQLLPSFEFVIEEDDPLNAPQRVLNVGRLVDLGVPITRAWVWEKFGLPPLDGGNELLVRIKGAPADTGMLAALRAAAARVTSTSDDATTLQTDRLDTDTAASWSAIMDTVKTLVDEATDMTDLRDRLLAAYGDLPSDQLTDIMGMAFAAADLAGRYEAREDADA